MRLPGLNSEPGKRAFCSIHELIEVSDTLNGDEFIKNRAASDAARQVNRGR